MLEEVTKHECVEMSPPRCYMMFPGKMGTSAFLRISVQTILLTLFLYRPLWAGDLPADACPLVNHSYKARVVGDHLGGAVGEEIVLSFILDPPQQPVGFFLAVNMSEEQTPNLGKETKPELVTGFPDTSMVFHVPGIYRYTVVVSLIAKSSCGGIKTDTIYNGEVKIEVTP